MASLGDLTLFVSAETDRAQKDIKGLGKEADKVIGKKRDIGFSVEKARNDIRDFKRDIKAVGQTAKAAYKVAKMEGFFDDEIESAELLAKKTKQVAVGLNDARKPGKLLSDTFKRLAGSTVSIVNGLAKVGFALYGLQQITGVLKQAFGGLFNNTVGRAVKLQESILKTQTALASTNDVLRNGKVITDPYEAIVALTGVIEKRIESIRQRSLDLAGVTSGEVIEVFGIVASQAGAIGASLEQAEDLAIKFAAALGTFGLPIQQARQEIGSILRGDVGPDSYLAKSLGIRSDDIKKAKNEVGGIVAFVNKKLEAAVAGQEIAARSFSGVASNIADFSELIGEAFGKPLVQPLIDGLTVVYDFLVDIKDAALGGAAAIGKSLASALSSVGTLVKSGQRTSVYDSLGFQSSGGQSAINPQEISNTIESLRVKADAFVARIQASFAKFIQLVGEGISRLAKGFANLGAAFVGLNVGIFETLLETLTNLLDILSPLIRVTADFVAVYGEFLRLPIVQTLSNVGAQLQLMERLGVNAFIKLTLVSVALIKSYGTLKAVVVGLVATIKGALVAGLTLVASGLRALQALLTPFIVSLGTANPALAAFALNLNKTAASATSAATGLKSMAGATAMLSKATIRFLKFNLILLAVTVGVAFLIELFNKFRRAAEEANQIKQFDKNIKLLNTTLSKTAVEGDKAKESLRSVAQAQSLAAVNTLKKNFLEAAEEVNRLEESVKKLEEDTKNANFFQAYFMDPAGSLRREQTRLKQSQKELHESKKEFISAEAEFAKLKDKERLEQDIETQGKNLGQLSERLAKAQLQLQRQVSQDRFNAEMELSQRRIDLTRSEEQERILLVENRNRKLIEGEEGTSAEALAGLVEYARTRNEAEADADAQRSQRVLAIQKLENEIENYKFQIGNKVLELRKQGAKIDQEAADYVAKVHEQIMLQRGQAATQEAAAAGETLPTATTGAARVGNTGRSTGPHIDIRGGSKAAVKQDAMALIKAWQGMGVEYIQLSNIKKDVQNITDPTLLSALVESELEKHGLRVPKGTFAIDIAVPEGTSIPGATLPTANQVGAAGHMAKLPSGNDILHLMNPTAAAAMSRPNDAALKAAVEKEFTPPDISGIETAKKGINDVLNSIQDSQTRVKALAADRQLKGVIESLVPKAQVEQFKNATIQAQKLSAAIADGQNVERAEIIADISAREVIANRELGQFLKSNAKIFKDDAETRDTVAANAQKFVDERIASFQEERKERLALIEVERTLNQVRSLADSAKAGTLSTDQGIITGTAQMNAGMEFDKFRSAEIMAQGRIDARRAELEQDGPMSDETLRKFEEFAQIELFNAERQAQMDAMVERFQMLGDVASGVGQAIGGAMTQGVADIMSGAASVDEVLSGMFKGIADSFMQMATKIIADMIKMIVLKQLVGLFGGPTGGGGGLGGMLGLGGGGGPNQGLTVDNVGLMEFAKGGIVTGPTAAMIGEGGMNEAVVPLPNGKSIPVDFGKKGAAGAVNTNITVNVDQGGNTSTEMTGEQAGKLGKAIDVAVKRVIMEERRSGGMLANGRR